LDLDGVRELPVWASSSLEEPHSSSFRGRPLRDLRSSITASSSSRSKNIPRSPISIWVSLGRISLSNRYLRIPRYFGASLRRMILGSIGLSALRLFKFRGHIPPLYTELDEFGRRGEAFIAVVNPQQGPLGTVG